MGRMLPLVTAISLSMATTLQAETLEMPTESATPAPAPAPASGGYTVTLPGRGMNMTQVEEKFGPPLQKLPEVGEPPIIRWIYPSYTVYFEYQFVINSILNSAAGAPPPPRPVVETTEETLAPEPMETAEPMAAPESMPPVEIPSPFEGVEIIPAPEEPMPEEAMPVTEGESPPVLIIDEEGEVIIPDAPANP